MLACFFYLILSYFMHTRPVPYDNNGMRPNRCLDIQQRLGEHPSKQCRNTVWLDWICTNKYNMCSDSAKADNIHEQLRHSVKG